MTLYEKDGNFLDLYSRALGLIREHKYKCVRIIRIDFSEVVVDGDINQSIKKKNAYNTHPFAQKKR